MTDITENIPTLSDIIQLGDESMLNHFDAHQLHSTRNNSDEYADQQDHQDDATDNMQNIMEVSDIFDNTNTFENSTSEPEEIPSITLADTQDEYIADEDFSDAMQLIIDNSVDSESETLLLKTNQSDKEILKEKVNLAIKEVLPAIEEQLKEKLFKQLDL